jgi:cytochrome P450
MIDQRAVQSNQCPVPVKEVIYPFEEPGRCPFPHYAALRREDPVHRVPGRDEYVVTRHDDISWVLRHPEIFSNVYLVTQNGVQRLATVEEAKADGVRGLAQADPPLHTKKRKLAFEYLKPGRIPAYGPMIEGVVEDLIDGFADRGELEFISEFANPLPTRVIFNILGLPPEDVPRADAWRVFDAWATPWHADERQDTINEAILAMVGYLREQILDRLESPRDDVLSDFAHAHLKAEGELDLPNLLADAANLLNGGIITTAHMLGSTMRLLVAHPDMLELALADKRFFVKAIEESLRLESPVQAMPRLVLSDTEIGGVPIPQGALVHLIYASANRDESKFRRPNDFDIARPDLKGHLAFGFRVHFCLGAPLARMEGKLAFERLFMRLKNIRLSDRNDFATLDSIPFRGLEALHIEFDRA